MARKIYLPFLCLILFVATTTESYSQRWKRYRHEVGFNAGFGNYMGDLGGAGTGDGTRYGDFQLSTTRPSFGAFYRYRALERVAFKGNLIYGRIYGDDAEAGNEEREARNLNFRSPVIELSVQAEYYFLKEELGSAYRMPGLKGTGSKNLSGYFFGGIGLFYFDPHGEDSTGTWVALADLNTEGQGLAGAPEDYSQVALAFPLGIGFKYSIDRQWSIGLEYGIRMTTTDYLDDVSEGYYDNTAIFLESGAKAAEMADKRIERRGRSGVRGNPDRLDSYMFGFVSLSYRFKSGRKGRTRF